MNDTPARAHSAFGEAFQAAAREGRLVLARCTACGRVLAYTRRVCACGSLAIAWEPARGEAIVIAAAVFRRTYAEAFPAPWPVVRVALEEGPRLCALWAGPTEARIGGAAALGFDPAGRLMARPLASP